MANPIANSIEVHNESPEVDALGYRTANTSATLSVGPARVSQPASGDSLKISVEPSPVVKKPNDTVNSSLFFIIVRWIAFVFATVISIFTNIMLVSNLERSYRWILIPMAITIEFSKLVFLMTSNIFRVLRYTLVKKAKTNKQIAFIASKDNLSELSRRSRSFFFGYLILALFSIFAAVGFSLSIVSKTAVVSDINSSIYNSQLDELSKIDAEIADLQVQISRESVQVQDYESRQSALDRINQWGQWDTVRRSLETSQARLSELNFRLAAVKQSQTEFIGLYGSAIQIKSKIDEIELQRLTASSSNLMFSELSKLCRLPEDFLRFIVLLFMGLLIEITVFSCSPDIRVSKSILKIFKNFIPFDIVGD